MSVSVQELSRRAHHEAGHAIVGRFFELHLRLWEVTLSPAIHHLSLPNVTKMKGLCLVLPHGLIPEDREQIKHIELPCY